MSTKNLSFLKDKKDLHHAYLIIGDINANVEYLHKIFGSSPEYYLYSSASFKVDDSRKLIERQKTKSFGGGDRFFIVAAHSYISEAQNALLKVLEEPIAGNHFFILSTNEEILLPTLRSRLMMIEGAEFVYSEIEDWCNKFIKSSLTDRMVMIDKFLKGEYEEDESKMLKHKTADVLSQLEKAFADKLRVLPDKKTAKFLSELIRMKGYLNDTSPSPRLILEYIGFISP